MRMGLILVSGTVKGDVDQAVRAERAGFDGVYTIEFYNRHGYVPLGAVAQATDRIRIGTAIANAFTRSPPDRPWAEIKRHKGYNLAFTRMFPALLEEIKKDPKYYEHMKTVMNPPEDVAVGEGQIGLKTQGQTPTVIKQ